MKILARGLITMLFVNAFYSLHAQIKPAAINGKVVLENGSALPDVVIILLNSSDSSAIRSSISDNKGLFGLSNIQPGNYILKVAKIGYIPFYSKPYQLTSGKGINTGSITLKSSPGQLKGIVVNGRKDPVENTSGKKVINVDQVITAGGNSVYELLASTPGVKVMDDQIMLRGSQKALIAIDGKTVQMTGEELVNLLKNYQGSSVSQIELIDNPGAKYDAAAGGGMINIIMKRNKELGSKFTLTQSAAYGDKYKSNTGINWTLKTEKLDVFASYGFQDNKVPHYINTNRRIVVGDRVDELDLAYVADIKSRNHNFNVSTDYQLTKNQTIGFIINGYFNNSNFNKRSTTNDYTNGVKDSSINANSDIARSVNNLTYNLNYKIKLDNAGKSVLSANGYYSNYQRYSNEDLENDFLTPDGKTSSAPIFFRDYSPSHITIRSENLDFSQVLSKITTMQAGFKNSQVNSDNEIDFSQLTDSGYMPVSSLSDHFVYKERINAAYIKFDNSFKTTTLSLSLRGEQTSSSGVSLNPFKRVFRKYVDFFPDVEMTQQLGKDNQLTAFYSRNIDRPNYQDLNPFVGYVDQFYYSTGNPFLKPDYVNTYQVSDLFLDKYKASLSYIVTDDFFNTIFQQDDFTKIYTTTKANLGTRYQYQVEFNVPIDIAKWWHIDADFTAFHEKYAYKPDTIAKKTGNGITLYVDQSFIITSKLSAQLYNAYESPTYFAISHYTTLHYMNAGLRYLVLKNNGSIRLAVSDIFNTNYNNYHTTYTNLDLTARDKLGSRFVTATFTYRFGNSFVKTGHGNNGNEEQKRLGSSSNEN